MSDGTEPKEIEFWQVLKPNGEVAGRDPREMTEEELTKLGHRAISPMRALRLRCLDCCAGSDSEVRHCPARKCPSWPFRMGTSPWRKFKLSDVQKENLKKLADSRRGMSVTIRVEPEMKAELEEQAAQSNTSLSEIVRTAANTAVPNRKGEKP